MLDLIFWFPRQKSETCFWRNSLRLREASTPKMVRRESNKTDAVIVSMPTSYCVSFMEDLRTS